MPDPMTTERPEPSFSFGFQYRYGSHKGPEAPAFCPDDGSPMRVTERPTGRFDPDTGRPIVERRADCTARIRFNHWHAVQDEHGDWPWTMR